MALSQVLSIVMEISFDRVQWAVGGVGAANINNPGVLLLRYTNLRYLQTYIGDFTYFHTIYKVLLCIL